MDPIPFHTFLWKVASRCNINCSYCYVYNLGDETWRSQPAFMSEEVIGATIRRMREHLNEFDKKDAMIIFHGGEPLLLGRERLERMVMAIREGFEPSGIKIKIGMQSNLLLFDEEIGDYLKHEGLNIGVSLDGPPAINDLYRVDHNGKGTSARLEEKLDLLTSDKYRCLFSGFLCVIDPEVDPDATLSYLLRYKPRSIDFLLPLNNYENRPKGKSGEALSEAPYGDWMIRCFDRWLQIGGETQIRYFKSIIQMMLGATSDVESIGPFPVDLIVVETNGDIEAVDSLKSAFEGATKLGYSVFRNSFSEVAADVRVKVRQLGLDGLCEKCQACEVANICGGGYFPHRYSQAAGFRNPSVYCADIMKLIHHIQKTIKNELAGVLSPPVQIKQASTL